MTGCSLCVGGGVVFAHLRDTTETGGRGLPYVFICTCRNGGIARYKKNYPQWSQTFLKSYELIDPMALPPKLPLVKPDVKLKPSYYEPRDPGSDDGDVDTLADQLLMLPDLPF